MMTGIDVFRVRSDPSNVGKWFLVDYKSTDSIHTRAVVPR